MNPCVRCCICGAERDGEGAGRHKNWVGHNCWELIMNQSVDFQASEYTFRRGIPQNKGIDVEGNTLLSHRETTSLK